MKPKITYIISEIDKSVAFEWICEEMHDNGFSLEFILLNQGDSSLERWLIESGIDVKRIRFTGKKSIPGAVLKIYRHLRKTKPKAIHTHLFWATLAGMIAGKLANIKQRIYTRHHSTYFHEYHPGMVKYDRYINRVATDIVSISQNVSEVLTQRELAKKEKITLIHHGFKLDEFTNVTEQTVHQLKEKYAINEKPAIGVISRYAHWKGIQYIIPAFKKLLQKYPEAILVMANASGEYKSEVQKLLKDIPTKNYREIIFEPDLFNLYKLFDVFVHTPIDEHSEAFGQIYVESLAAGIPSIFTLSGVAREFIEDEQNALVVPFCDSKAIHQSMIRLLEDQELCQKLSRNGQEKVQTLFTLDKMIHKLKLLYKK